MSKHVAIYARVSTRNQDTKSQEPDLKLWATAFAGDVPVKWYRDQQSGKTMNRPAWNRLEAAINAGRVASVVAWRLDRLGRTATGMTALFEKLVTRGINLDGTLNTTRLVAFDCLASHWL